MNLAILGKIYYDKKAIGGIIINRTKEACHCHNVTYGQIMDAISAGATNFPEVQAITHCSTGCGKCQEFIEILIRDLLEEQKGGRQP